MTQTPVHESHNPDLLRLIPVSSKNIIEIGCSSGALAREFKKISPNCQYTGVEIEPTYAELAKRYCDVVKVLNIDESDQDFFQRNKDCDTWIFGDTLEHLKNPWRILESIRAVIPMHGSVVACIPNAQHWSLQVKLSVGDFRYEDSGLLDKTHLRWFTRQTIIELFASTGYSIAEGFPRIFNEPDKEKFLHVIGEMAERAGANPQLAMEDAQPFQYVVRGIPVPPKK